MSLHLLAGVPAQPEFLQAALGRAVAARKERLPGHRLAAFWDGAIGLPVAGTGKAEAVCLDLSPQDDARLSYVLTALGAVSTDHPVSVDGQPRQARLWLGRDPAAPDWQVDPWRRDFAATVLAALPDLLALQGEKPADQVARRFGQMLVRSGSRLRAAAPQPATLRHLPQKQDIALQARREPYAHFFAVEEYDLSYRRFAGDMSRQVTRAAFVSGDAVTVLPYDPRRDRVLLIEQFRAGPMARGDANPWSLEAIAGRIDPGETAEAAARREAQEEAGLTLGPLLPVAGYYPSPGAKTEFLYSYVALCDLPENAAGVFGLAEEAEDIRGHLVTLDQMLALVASGEINNAPLVLTALWLQREAPRLRAEAGL